MFPAGGALTQTVTVVVQPDDDIEADEHLQLKLDEPSTSSGSVQVAGSGTGTGTIENDDIDTTPPGLQSVRIFDLDGDGKLDFLIANFDEPVATSCPGSWSFSDASGGSVQSATANGATVQVFLNEGSGHNTSPAVDVAFSGTCDATGNNAPAQSVSRAQIVDRAAPAVTSVSSSNGGSTVGRAQQNDTVTLNFSESVSGIISPVNLNIANNQNNDRLTIAGVATIQLGSNYVGGSPTFQPATVSGIGTASLEVTLGACAGTGNACSTEQPSNLLVGSPAVAVVAASGSLRDAALNSAGAIVNPNGTTSPVSFSTPSMQFF